MGNIVFDIHLFTNLVRQLYRFFTVGQRIAIAFLLLILIAAFIGLHHFGLEQTGDLATSNTGGDQVEVEPNPTIGELTGNNINSEVGNTVWQNICSITASASLAALFGTGYLAKRTNPAKRTNHIHPTEEHSPQHTGDSNANVQHDEQTDFNHISDYVNAMIKVFSVICLLVIGAALAFNYTNIITETAMLILVSTTCCWLFVAAGIYALNTGLKHDHFIKYGYVGKVKAHQSSTDAELLEDKLADSEPTSPSTDEENLCLDGSFESADLELSRHDDGRSSRPLETIAGGSPSTECTETATTSCRSPKARRGSRSERRRLPSLDKLLLPGKPLRL